MDKKIQASKSFISAFQISVSYLLFGMLWIYFSDRCIGFLTNDSHQILIWQTYKGFFFIGVTALLLYLLSHKILRDRHAEYERHLSEQKKAQLQLSQQDALLKTIINSSPDAIFVKDLEGKYLLFNTGAGDIIGLSPEKVIGKNDNLIFSPEAANRVKELDRFIISERKIINQEEYITTTNGIEKIFWSTKGPLFTDEGKIYGLFGISREITESKAIQLHLEQQYALLNSLINSSPDAIVIKGLDRRYIVFNKGASEFSGVDVSDAIGKTADEIFPPQTAHIINTIDNALIDSNAFIEHEESMLMPNGETYIYWVTKGLLKTAGGDIFGIYGIYRNITSMKNNEQIIIDEKERFDHLAHIDVLTGLPNRLSLNEFLTSKSLKSAPFTLFFIDLDGFKEINDSYGHRFGDELLIRVTKILKEVFPSESYIVRTGGDEFAIILESTQENSTIDSFMTQLHDFFNAPILINTIDVYITASIGIAIYPKDADNTEELLQKADAAMYRAKNMGRNTYSYYNLGLTQEVLERTTLASNLKKAIANHELLLHYQPQIDPNSGKMTGVEALLRWPTPEGMIPPSVFIPLAEERGLIVELGSFVLEEGFIMAKKWSQEGRLNGRIAINVSAKQLLHPHFLVHLEELLQKTKCDPAWIEIEITESSILEYPEKVIALLGMIKEKGFKISIDDFGTGYSSLSYLKNLPVDKLKIDISFVRDITDHPKNQTIVKTIIALAKGLGMTTIAEGVETSEELQFLRQHHIDSIQGYYYHKPMSTEDIELLFTAGI